MFTSFTYNFDDMIIIKYHFALWKFRKSWVTENFPGPSCKWQPDFLDLVYVQEVGVREVLIVYLLLPDFLGVYADYPC